MAAGGSGDGVTFETDVLPNVGNVPAVDYEKVVLTSNKEGMDLLRKGQYKQAFEQLKYAEALVVSKQGKDEATNLMSVTCNNLGCYYKKVGKLHAALSYLRKALKIEVSLQTDDVTVAGTHLNVCAILSKLDKHDKALQHALCALELIKSRTDSLGESSSQDEYSVLAIAYHNVAVEHDFLQQLHEAAMAYQQGHEVAKRCLGDQHPLTQTLAKNASAALQKSEAKAEAERGERELRDPREARRKNSNSQALPEIARPKDPSLQDEGDEESRDQWNWTAPTKGASGFLPPLQQTTSSLPVSQTFSSRPEEGRAPSPPPLLFDREKERAPSPPPLLFDRDKDHPESRRPREAAEGSVEATAAPKRPPRTRNGKAPAVGQRDMDAGLVPAAQQSQLLRKSAAEKIQHFWRDYNRHKLENRYHLELETKAATKIQATWRGFAVRQRRATKAAVTIQRHLRGFFVRIALRRHRAAVVIQRHAVGFLTRKNLREAVDAAVRIQRIARARMASVNVEARRRLVQHAAKLVRCSIRTWLVREELTTLRVAYEHEQAKERAVIKIQSCWRGSCARQQVTNARTARKKRIMLFRASASLQGTRSSRPMEEEKEEAEEVEEEQEEEFDEAQDYEIQQMMQMEPEDQEPVLVRVRMVNGDVHSCEALPFDTIRRLKAQLATRTGVPAHQQRLLLGTELLKDQLMLRDLHFDEGTSRVQRTAAQPKSASRVVEWMFSAEDQLMLRDLHFDEGRQLPELTLVLGPPIPSWAFELGFDGDFPGCLRDYFAKHSEEQPPWLDHDVEIWERFRMYEEENMCRSYALRGWNHFVQLVTRDGEIRGIVRAAPNQEIELEARGWIQNCTGDNTATHQLLLAVDTWVVGELYSGVPSFKDPFATPIRFTAPKADGVYMLWRSGDLQDTMVDAKRFFELRHTRADPELYPTNFVGWLIVKSPPVDET